MSVNGTHRQQTLLILGGSRYIIPVIDAAHALGCRVVTSDYLPDNIAHAYADEYVNTSIVDKDAVLATAQAVHADGIMSFAADPGVVSAAWTAERLGLPFQASYEATRILQTKSLFRQYLHDHGFICPRSFAFASVEQATAVADELPYPVIAKPVDAAGSKGVTRVDAPDALAPAVAHALTFSRSGGCIVEQFLEKQYASSDSDSFAVNGELRCASFTSQLFDVQATNPYAPAAFAMPATMPASAQAELRAEIQRLFSLLGVQSGIFNIETRVATDGKPYIMEVSPRGGGNRLAEMLRYASDVDLIRASVQAALGMEVQGVTDPRYDGYWYQSILHSDTDGTFRGVEYADGFRDAHVRDESLWIEPGAPVHAFDAANYAFGTVMMRFETQAELDEFARDVTRFMRVVVA